MPGTPWCHAPAKLFTWIEIIIMNYSWALHLCAKLCSEHFISIKSYNLHSVEHSGFETWSKCHSSVRRGNVIPGGFTSKASTLWTSLQPELLGWREALASPLYDFWTTSQVRKRKSESWEIAGMAGHEVHQLRPEKAPVVRSRPSLPASAGPAPNTQPRSQSRCFCLTQEDSMASCAAGPHAVFRLLPPGRACFRQGRLHTSPHQVQVLRQLQQVPAEPQLTPDA